jgi:hypothetical protein
MLGGHVHVVTGVEVHARLVRGEALQVARDDAARRIAHVPGHPAGPPVSDDRADSPDVGEHRLHVRGVADVEGHARHQQPVAETLEHRRHAEAPGRKAQNQCIGLAQALDIGAEPRLVGGDFVVPQALLAAHHRIEPFGIEIAVVHGVAGLAQALHDVRVQRGVEAGLHRVAVDDENVHPDLSIRSMGQV